MMDFLVMKSVCVDKGSLVIDVNILFLTRWRNLINLLKIWLTIKK
jgi:hypothetical protein